MTKKTLKKKSFAEIAKLKKSIDIVHENEILFTLFELNNTSFREVLNKIITKVLENQDNQITTLSTIEQEITPYLIKNMFSSEMYSLDDLSDDEIMETLNNMGSNIISQVNSAIETLVMRRINSHFETLKEVSKGVEE